MMELDDHPGIVALLCMALLIWVRSTVPYEKRTSLELRLLWLWHSALFTVLKRIKGWLKR